MNQYFNEVFTWEFNVHDVKEDNLKKETTNSLKSDIIKMQ